MYKYILFFCSIVISTLGLAQRDATVAPNSALDHLISKILATTPIFDDLLYLTDTIGGRPTGSLAMNDAIQWGLQRFIDAGLKDAYLDAYTAPRNWLPNIEQGEIVSAKNQSFHALRIAAMPFTAATPLSGLTALIYALDTAEVAAIQEHAAQIKGHWLMIPTPLMRSVDNLFKEFLETPLLFSAAQKAGAVGVLWLSNRPGRLLYRHSASLNGEMVSLPAALIEREGGDYLLRLLKAGVPLSFKATLRPIIQENPRNYNVVAEIKGTENSDEVIVFGAHLDSWDLGQGALDNGSNAVMVIDAARQIAALQQLGFSPRRTIRFILYSGEEFGLYGSWFDVKNHPQALDSIKAVVIYDVGTGRTTGFSLGGRSDMQHLVRHMLQPIDNLGPFTQTIDASFGTDNFDYLLKGIPTLVANQDAEPYLPYYHAESDTLDKVDFRELKLNTVIAAVLVWNLANTTDIMPARQSQTEINQLLKSTGLKQQMDAYQIENHELP
jgi:carboxypeptidase Q